VQLGACQADETVTVTSTTANHVIMVQRICAQPGVRAKGAPVLVCGSHTDLKKGFSRPASHTVIGLPHRGFGGTQLSPPTSPTHVSRRTLRHRRSSVGTSEPPPPGSSVTTSLPRCNPGRQLPGSGFGEVARASQIEKELVR